MLYRILISFLIILFTTSFSKQQPVKKPVSIIFDTDIGPDYDDVGAITMLHVFADRGDAKILATVGSNKYEGIAAVLNVFNTYFNKPEIPIGVVNGKAVNIRDSQHWTDTIITKYPHRIKQNDEVPDAVEIYRKVLSAQPDQSVTIVTVGFLTNLANLLNSKSDANSKLSGEELIKKKVKLLVSMAGKFPFGWEFNIMKDAVSSKVALENWPTPVIYSGFEIGEKIHTGLPLIHNNEIHNSPVKDVFGICIPLATDDSKGRMSWDETAVYVAVKGYQPYYDLHPGKIKVATDGSNSWDENGNGQNYLVAKESPQKMEDVINNLIMQQPGLRLSGKY
jgi:inosine-uridine nucleoside N-ribohydrolase